MSQPMSRAQARRISAVGLGAGLLFVGLAVTASLGAGANPDDVQAQTVQLEPLPEQSQDSWTADPDMIADWISTAYRHDFPDEAVAEVEPTVAPTPSGSNLRLLGAIGAGDSAVAIFAMDARQLLLGPGDSGPDFLVEEVHADRAVIVRAGERIEMPLGPRNELLITDIRPGSGIPGIAGPSGGSQGVFPDRATSTTGGVTVGADGTVIDDAAVRARAADRERLRAERLRQLSEERGDVSNGADGNGANGNGANGAAGGNGNGAPRPRSTMGRPAGGNGASNN